MTAVETTLPTMDDLTEWATLQDLVDILAIHGIRGEDIIRPGGIEVTLNHFRKPTGPPLVLRVTTYDRDEFGDRYLNLRLQTWAKKVTEIPIAALPVLAPKV